jgi:hypothetical protein
MVDSGSLITTKSLTFGWSVYKTGKIMNTKLALCLLCSVMASCDADQRDFLTLDDAAETYVKLALELGEYDPDYVDAYLGPGEWAEAAKENLRPEDELAGDISSLLASLKEFSPDNEESKIRHKALLRNVRAMDTRIRMVRGETFSFEEESLLIYDVVVPDYDFSEFDLALEEVAKLFPGDGDLAERVDEFRNDFVIPDVDRDVVMTTAIEECKNRTLEYISLPPSEHFTLEYVTGKSWTGYNWYQGENESLVQINVDFPPKIGNAVRLGCHEGYPGHHVWNVLVENRLLKERGWIEYSVFPLFGPTALIAEGSANYGVYLAFPDTQKMEYERDVLFPLAGLDPDKALLLEKLNSLTRKLGHAQIATAQLYLNGDISREEAIDQRQKYSLVSRPRAEQSVRFIEQYRSYVLNYSLGQDVVREYIESQGDDPKSRWEALERMLTELSFASDMSNQ